MCFEDTWVIGLLVQKFEHYIRYEQMNKLKKKYIEQKLLKQTNKYFNYFVY